MYREYPIAMFDYQRVFSIFILCLHSEDIDIYISLSIDIEAHFQGISGQDPWISPGAKASGQAH